VLRLPRYIKTGDLMISLFNYKDLDGKTRSLPNRDCDNRPIYISVEEIKKAIVKTPTADVEPVVHARWIFQKGVFANNGTKGCFECSACKAIVDLETFDRMCECGQTRKCGACGARMDKEEEK